MRLLESVSMKIYNEITGKVHSLFIRKDNES